MNRKRFQLCTWLLWLSLPLMALRHWQVWDRLPASMAVHFNAGNQTNGWMRRSAAIWFDMGLLAFMLILFTAIRYVSQPKAAVTATSWAVLLFFYGVIGTICYIQESVLNYNLYGKAIHGGAFRIMIAALTLGLIGARMGLHRADPLPSGDLISEEVQRGQVWALIVLAVLIPLLLIIASVPVGTGRVAMAAFALLLLITAVAAWDGFHYLFTQHGLEVRTLGFRLKSLPVHQISAYHVTRWAPIGTYGIRGIGGRSAYVWTTRGVRIETEDGFVFLSHKEPERLVDDLNRIMNVPR
jgi:hypothetical protein